MNAGTAVLYLQQTLEPFGTVPAVPEIVTLSPDSYSSSHIVTGSNVEKVSREFLYC